MTFTWPPNTTDNNWKGRFGDKLDCSHQHGSPDLAERIHTHDQGLIGPMSSLDQDRQVTRGRYDPLAPSNTGIFSGN